MTAVTTSPATETGLTPSVQAQARGASFLTATGQAARRTLLQYLRTPQLIVLPTVTSVLFLFMFRYIFGGAITTGTRGIDYVDFLIPGFVATAILWTGMSATSGVAEDALSGVHDRCDRCRSLGPRSSPAARSPTRRSSLGRCSSTSGSATPSAFARTPASDRWSSHSE